MKDKLFNELIASVRAGGAILRGEKKPARSFKITTPNIKRIREHNPLQIVNRKSKIINPKS